MTFYRCLQCATIWIKNYLNNFFKDMGILKTRLTMITSIAFVLLLLQFAHGSISCPLGCSCKGFKVNCSLVINLYPLGQTLPPETATLEILRSPFEDVMEFDFATTPAVQLSTLLINFGNLTEIHDNAFSTLGELMTLDLSHNKIERVGRDAFMNLKMLRRLDLSYNKIQHLASANILKPLIEVVEVDFKNNQLVDFPSGFFSSQSHLQELNIGYNEFVNLKGSSFQGVPNLKKFRTPSCNIQTLENDLFKSLRSIEEFDLSYNQLRFLPLKGELSQLINLRNLNIRGNSLVSLSDNQFEGLNINKLDLSNNAISSVTNNTFMHMEGLNYLDISNNNLKSLPSFFLQPIANSLTRLKMNSNQQLTSLPPTLFDGLNKLVELNLSSCGLLELNYRHFEYLTSIQHVDLSANQLTFLPDSFFAATSKISMQFVRLDHNQWYCNCRINTFREWLNDKQTSSILFCQDKDKISFRKDCLMPMCSTPSRLVGSQIDKLTEDVLDNCENTGKNSASGNAGVIVGVVVGIIVVFMILVVVIILCLYKRHRQGKHIPCATKEEDNQELRGLKKPSNIVRNPEKPLNRPKKPKKRKENKYFKEKKEKRSIDPEIGSLNESDKDYIVRNYFRSMTPDVDEVSEGTQSMTRKSSVESLSQSGYGYGSRHGSQDSSQYSLNAGCKFESAV
ncbi:platelet glycoprotein V-like [Mya arenaria]|uniref:platelet glycoprotein V-like n=1 Tax=Mya arenaria TaxID=6604 RepID=UPI0022E4F81E|nr:platelet glycoprotein V-like [Mya arenaria]